MTLLGFSEQYQRRNSKEKPINSKEDEILEEYIFCHSKRGPGVSAGPNKERITIRIDADTMNWLRDYVNAPGGFSYQTLFTRLYVNITMGVIRIGWGYPVVWCDKDFRLHISMIVLVNNNVYQS